MPAAAKLIITPPAATIAKQDTAADAVNYAARCNRVTSDVAPDWMQVYRRIVNSEGKNPPQASRIYAYAALGLYEAVQPGYSYRSLGGQISGLNNLPNPCRFGRLDYTLCANEALYQVAKTIFVTLKPQNLALLDSLHNDYLADASYPAGSSIVTNSVTFGQQVATAVLNRADNDNFATTRALVYVVPSQSVNPAFWAPTGPALSPMEPYWGTLKGFALTNNTSCTVPTAIPFSTAPGSAFYKQAFEVDSTVNNLTQTQKDIALWWADGTSATPTPPGHWVGIENIIAKKFNLNLGDAALMYAAVNMGMADAFISCWNEKYAVNLLRPVTYIRSYIAGQSAWSSFIVTPPFPEYPSGHSVASGTAADMLTRLFGRVAFTDSSNTGLGLAPHSYTSFNEAANEAAISRLYGGIHYREAIENGLQQGRAVSKNLVQHIRF